MAATMNIPMATSLPPVADKPPVAAAADSSGGGDFSRTLGDQMERKAAENRPEPQAKPKEKQEVENSGSMTRGAMREAVGGRPAKAAASAEATTTGKAEAPAEAATTADPLQAELVQAAITPQLLLENLIALSTASGGGKDLPTVANIGPLQTAGSADANLSALANTFLADLNRVAQAYGIDPEQLVQRLMSMDASTDPQSAEFAALQKQLQDLLAKLPTSLTADMQDIDAGKLQGLLHALQSVAAAADRLESQAQGVQPDIDPDRKGQGDAATRDMRQQLAMSKDSSMPNLSESVKLTRIAFQEMLSSQLAKSGGDNSRVVAPGTDAANAMAGLVQPSTTTAQALATNSPALQVNVPVGHAQWGQAMGERLQWMVNNGQQEAEIQLNPKNLGPIEIKIAMNQDQATVTIVATHALTRDALDAALPRLKEMFGDTGLTLVDVNVSQDSPKGQQAQNEGEGGHNRHRHSSDGEGWQESTGMDAQVGRASRWIGGTRVLDTYA